MKLRQLAHWGVGLVLVAGLVVGAGSAIAQSGSVTPAQPTDTLYDQTDNAGSNSTDSINWCTNCSYRTQNSQAADDFVVPITSTWHIATATASGTYVPGVGNGVLSLLVQFYADSGNGLPRSLVLSQTIPSTSFISGLDTGVFVVALSPQLTLSPGHYWFSAQASLECTASNCKKWAWTERSVQGQVASVWQNPLEGVVPYCPTWQPRVDVCHNPPPENSTGKDLLFKLDGTSSQVNGLLFFPLIRH